ncbi:hypothetical protein LEN26_018477 [Aphanomyces euteiches]|nr:hypothetical protein LEN26_018477 [Aphanomyces euteiches]KAH9125377.1 hypothetical protein AeMF1_003998 [Aphanomyces euteiches]KAH9187941.1 hypothetical protein AeNC1_010087 [Aphanomyces euteiches]
MGKPVAAIFAFLVCFHVLDALPTHESSICSTQRLSLSRIDCYPVQPGFLNATEESCLAQGCCWDASQNPPCTFGNLPPPSPAKCSAVPRTGRMACRNPRYFIQAANASTCAAMGCCFDNSTCFQQSFDDTYNLTAWQSTPSGYTGRLVLSPGFRGPFGNDIPELVVHVHLESDTRVRVRILDPKFRRYEVPLPLFNLDHSKERLRGKLDRLYVVSVTYTPFGLSITRRSTGEVVFNSTSTGHFNGLIFSNQFIEFSTAVPSPPRFFGLGEHVGRLLGSAQGDHYTMWTRDQLANRDNEHTASGGDNEYGVYPLYIRIEDSGAAHGVYLVNSNALEVVAQPHAMTFRTVGGIVDFFVFLGPSAPQVVEQYTALVGRPMIPPYWSLGYHLCRYQYKNASQVRGVVDAMRKADVPQDTQWTDIDVLQDFLDFTWNNATFPNMSGLIQDLHLHEQHYIPIVDAGIGVSHPSYHSYVEGLRQNVFMTDGSTTKLDINRVWPGDVAYPDFFHPNASSYWKHQLSRYYTIAQYDGIWLDMNEPSSFCTDNDHKPTSCRLPDRVVRSKDTAFPFDPFRQPYAPGQKRSGNLGTMTASLAAHQYVSLHYNLHSLYGHSELKATRQAIDSIRQKRSFVLSRSSYAGDGQYAAHWLGDNTATWEDLRLGLAGVLAMNIFGMPMVGPDACGFDWDTTKELCIRWHQASILYPFLRNHNAGTKDQAPVDFDDETTKIMRNVLRKRYQLLPYLYTELYRAHVDGTTVVRALYFEFPSMETLAIDRQYLVGSALLVSPVLDKGALNVTAFLPLEATWYDLWTGQRVHHLNGKALVELDVPLEKVPVHIRGGYIVPGQAPSRTTAASRRNPFELVVALPEMRDNTLVQAHGELYLDGGDSIDPVRTRKYSRLLFSAVHYREGYLFITGRVDFNGYNGPELKLRLESIKVYGVEGYALGQDIQVEYFQDGATHDGLAHYNDTAKTLSVVDLDLIVGKPFALRALPSHQLHVGSTLSKVKPSKV